MRIGGGAVGERDAFGKGLSPSLAVSEKRYDEEGDVFTLGLARGTDVLNLALSLGA